jgi:hypothetical protein
LRDCRTSRAHHYLTYLSSKAPGNCENRDES